MVQSPFDLPQCLLLAAMLFFVHRSTASPFENKTGPTESRSRVFSPRMDYDEWTPLGRGDPLKNDPTFDYVPPVLDRVQYWLNTHTTEPSTKRDILVLGVTAKKTSPKIPEHFLKFLDGPKFNRNQDTFRNDFTGSTGAEPPKMIRNNNFRSGPMDFRNQNRIQSIPASYYPSPFYNQKPKPYTMMMPPPVNQNPINELGQNSYGNLLKEKIVFQESQKFSTQTEEGPSLQEAEFYNHPPKMFSQGQPLFRSTHSHISPAPVKAKITPIENKSIFSPSSEIPNQRFEATTSSVSFEKSNLIYQSTQTLSGGWIGSSRPTSFAPPVEINQVTWKAPNGYEGDHHASASANHDVVIGQNANIIVDGDSNDNEEVVIGHNDLFFQESNSQDYKEKALLEGPSVTTSTKPLTESYTDSTGPKMHIVVANSPSAFELEAQKEPVSVIMPVNYVESNVDSSLNSTESASFISTSTQNSLIQNHSSKMNDNMNQNADKIPSNSVSSQELISSPESSGSNLMSMERPLHMQKPQPIRSSISSPMMPIFMENTQTDYSSNILSNRIPPTSQTARHPGFHIFGESVPQHMALQHPRPLMTPRPGEHRPGFRPPISMDMGQIPPSMIHIKMGSPQSAMRPHMSADLAYQHHQHQQHQHQQHQYQHQHQQNKHQIQQHQIFPATFTSSPVGASSTLHVTRGELQGHRYSPVPNPMLLTTMQSSIFPPTTRGPVSINGEFFMDYTRNQSPLIHLLNSEESQKMESGFSTDLITTPSSLQTTTAPSLTTDPIFSHYKQPAKPIRGPMYLIIQGHSKVKTYKPTVNKYGVPVENNEILDNTTERPQSKLEKLVNENAKANAANREKDLSARRKLEERKENREEPISLLSLVENGFSAFTVSPPPATEEERQTNSVTTIEINGN
ncbi:uncharacterized protein LOC117179133 [Belonocnema kinseyi]|uniref:uncharacterized protein LOC117179133 n=1 Tax=Belonocnema kinseyi TaxID=2817044 RepID=UPI00143D7374|nr:uncharacterized protein LOC117179133 [Belonocnema kinseyi]